VVIEVGCATLKQIREKYDERRVVIGDFQASVTFSFSGMTFGEVKGSHDDVCQEGHGRASSLV
jgi:hypothetical protein